MPRFKASRVASSSDVGTICQIIGRREEDSEPFQTVCTGGLGNANACSGFQFVTSTGVCDVGKLVTLALFRVAELGGANPQGWFYEGHVPDWQHCPHEPVIRTTAILADGLAEPRDQPVAGERLLGGG